jgi:D-alanyl-D-alanine carboxypeptidase/D-alanyl-D-alanine-endopeptidase (penicillin-binding protein 4)
MVKLLTYLKNQKTISATFLSMFPVAGKDGTLVRRMKKTAADGRVRAKTGYLRPVPAKGFDGAVSLAGFANHPNGRMFTFVFFYNGLAAPDVVRRTFDNICIVLVGGKPVEPAPPQIKKRVQKKAPAKRKAKTSKRI